MPKVTTKGQHKQGTTTWSYPTQHASFNSTDLTQHTCQ